MKCIRSAERENTERRIKSRLDFRPESPTWIVGRLKWALRFPNVFGREAPRTSVPDSIFVGDNSARGFE